MKFYLFSDNEDTLVGMRLAGIEGQYITEKEELISVLSEYVVRQDVGIILINTSLASKIEKELLEFKRNGHSLIVEIPDVDADGEVDGISKYVSEAIGLKI